MVNNPKCFVLMYSNNELISIYEDLENHLMKKFSIQCYKISDARMGLSRINQIKTHVTNADIIIVDCSGNNPNVFYEFGLVDCHNKKMIFVTQDDLETLPSDIQQYEFIRYDLTRKTEFIENIERKINYLMVGIYEEYFDRINYLCDKFEQDKGIKIDLDEKSDIIGRIKGFEGAINMPPLTDYYGSAHFVITYIVRESQDVKTKFKDWLLVSKYENQLW